MAMVVVSTTITTRERSRSPSSWDASPHGSPFPEITNLVYKEHNALHKKHETVLEREYIRAFQTPFNYQRDVVKNLHGAAADPFVVKVHLLMGTLKVSKAKNWERFLDKLRTLWMGRRKGGRKGRKSQLPSASSSRREAGLTRGT
jgi:hypothetical protein